MNVQVTGRVGEFGGGRGGGRRVTCRFTCCLDAHAALARLTCGRSDSGDELLPVSECGRGHKRRIPPQGRAVDAVAAPGKSLCLMPGPGPPAPVHPARSSSSGVAATYSRLPLPLREAVAAAAVSQCHNYYTHLQKNHAV
eukprot:scaffold4002_cov123-Isochrysis_galbana.AAC.4